MNMNSPWLIYGANGYSGELAVREAVKRGLRPTLGGRNRERVEALGRELSLPTRAVSLDDGAGLDAMLEDVDLVLHAAGPFVHTSRPMVDSCLRSRTHYLDITGEIGVFERVLRRGDEARDAGVALIPGVGFDVVPSDCLAAMLAAKMPNATKLDLAFYGKGSGISKGTLKTMIEGIAEGGAVRQGGKIVRVPTAFHSRDIEFSSGVRHAMTIPWGDVSTAWYSTEIPDIRVYTGTPPAGVRRLRRLRPFLPLLGFVPLRRALQYFVRNKEGPDEETRATATMYLWGEVSDESGASESMTMSTPEGYRFTAISSISSVEKVLSGEVAPGAWTPSRAFGAEFALTLEGVKVPGGHVASLGDPPVVISTD